VPPITDDRLWQTSKICYLNIYSGNRILHALRRGIVTYGGWDRILNAILRGTGTATIWQHCLCLIQAIDCKYAYRYTPKLCIKQEMIDHVWSWEYVYSFFPFIFHLVSQTFPNVWCNGLMINTLCHSIWYFAVFFSCEKVDHVGIL